MRALVYKIAREVTKNKYSKERQVSDLHLDFLHTIKIAIALTTFNF